jgi:hypothetical protein
MKIHPVMDRVELNEAGKNQIDGDDVVEEPRDDQNQYPGEDGDKRRDMGSGDDHGFIPSVCWGDRIGGDRMALMGRQRETDKARQD